MHEFFGASTTWRQPVILATDISVSSLHKAAQAVYPEAVLAAVPERYQKYFVRTGSQQVRVSDEIRRMVLFKRLNLNQQDYPFKNRFHAVFCRNVMIYFDKSTQQSLINRYWDLLDSGGVLFTGHSESLTGIDHKFNYVQPTIYQKP